MFYIIGDCKDSTVKGLEIIKRSGGLHVYPNSGTEALEDFYGRKLSTRAGVGRVDTEVVHNIKVKQPTLESLTKKKEYVPSKFMSVSEALQQLLEILKNKGQDNLVTENTLCIGLGRVGSETQKILACSLQEMSQVDLGGTLTFSHYWRTCIVDVKVKQPTLESLTKKKKKEYIPPKFMSVSEASQQLLEIVKNKGHDNLVTENTLCIGLARVESETQKVLACSLQEMSQVDLGDPYILSLLQDMYHPLEI